MKTEQKRYIVVKIAGIPDFSCFHLAWGGQYKVILKGLICN